MNFEMNSDQVDDSSNVVLDGNHRSLLIDEMFMLAIEERAAELEVTCDYYMQEFM